MHYSAKRGLAITCRLSVCPTDGRTDSVCLSVTLVDHDHIGWKSWKLIVRTISPTSSLFVAQRSSTYSQGNMEKFGEENVRSTPTSITSIWIESTESHVILGGGVTVCVLLSAHRAVIFAIAQLCCFNLYPLFGNSPTSQTGRRIFALDGLNDADSRKDVPFGVSLILLSI